MFFDVIDISKIWLMKWVIASANIILAFLQENIFDYLGCLIGEDLNLVLCVRASYEIFHKLHIYE